MRLPRTRIRDRAPLCLTGFTLVEMLVVVAIIVALVAVIAPSLERAEDIARTATCASNNRQMYLAQASYHVDHFSQFVPMKLGTRSFSDFLMPYLYDDWEFIDNNNDGRIDDGAYPEDHVFRCPGEKKRTVTTGSANHQQLDLGLNNYGRYNNNADNAARYHQNFNGKRLQQIGRTNIIWGADADPGSSPEDIGGLSRDNNDRTWPLYASFETKAYIRHALRYNATYLDGSVKTLRGYEPAFEEWLIPKADRTP